MSGSSDSRLDTRDVRDRAVLSADGPLAAGGSFNGVVIAPEVTATAALPRRPACAGHRKLR
jgi:hypothetical protein